MFNNKENVRKQDSIETVIGPSVTLEGNFDGNGDIIIEGSVLGVLKTSGMVRIGSEAKLKAEVKARSVFVSGEVKGNIEADEKVELSETAKVTGNIKSSTLHISSGAFFQGKSMMGAVQHEEPAKTETKEKDKAKQKN